MVTSQATSGLTCWIFASVLFTNPPAVCCPHLQFENIPLPVSMPSDLLFHVFSFSTFNHPSTQFPISPSVSLLPHVFWYSSAMYRKDDFFVLYGRSGLSTTVNDSCPLLLTHSGSFTEHTEQVTDRDLKSAITA